MVESSGQAAVEVANLTVSYAQRIALRGVSLSITPGQVVGVIGPNGAGKSTLLKAIMELLPLVSGRVAVFGQPVARMRRVVAYVPQREAVDWDYPVSVEDVVMMGRYPHLGWHQRARRLDREIAARSLAQVEIDGLRRRQIGQLSGGQQQRVFLARALAQEALVYLLDEPFVGVDAATERAIVSLMTALRDQGKTVLVVNHDLERVKHYDSLVLLNQSLVAFGPTADVFTAEVIGRTYGGRLAALQFADQLAAEK